MSQLISLRVSAFSLEDKDAFLNDCRAHELEDIVDIDLSWDCLGFRISMSNTTKAVYEEHSVNLGSVFSIVDAIQSHIADGDACSVSATIGSELRLAYHDFVITKDKCDYSIERTDSYQGILDRLKATLELGRRERRLKDKLYRVDDSLHIPY